MNSRKTISSKNNCKTIDLFKIKNFIYIYMARPFIVGNYVILKQNMFSLPSL